MVLLSIVVFIYVFGPITRVFGLGAIEDTSFLVSIVVVASWVVYGRSVGVRKEVVYLAGMVLCLPSFMFFSGLLQLFAHGLPALMLYRSIRILITIVAGFILADAIVRNSKIDPMLMTHRLVLGMITFHAVIMLIMLFSPEFKEAIHTYTNAGSEEILQINREARIAGLAGAGGAFLSVMQSFGVFVGVFLFGKEKGWAKILVVISALLCLFSTVISGRTGMYFSLFGLLVYPLFAVKRRLNWYGLLLVGFCVFALAGYPIIRDLYENKSSFEWLINRTFATWILFFETGKIHDATLAQLAGEAEFSNEILTYLVGLGSDEGYYGRYFSTDLGYLKYLAAFGFFGMIPALLPYLYMIVKSVRMRYMLLTTLLILSFVAHSKELFLYGRMAFNTVLLMFFVAVITEKKSSFGLQAGMRGPLPGISRFIVMRGVRDE